MRLQGPSFSSAVDARAERSAGMLSSHSAIPLRMNCNLREAFGDRGVEVDAEEEPLDACRIPRI